MVAHVYTVAFQGIEAREVDVQVHVASQTSIDNPFSIVGLADKAVAESRERVRAALSAIGLALPHQKITINLAPADLPKEGSHYDLPIALGLLAAMGVLPASEMANYSAMGELSLDAQLTPVAGVLPAALAASEAGRGLICPAACGPEAAWAGALEIIAAPSLIAIVNHMKGVQVLNPPAAKVAAENGIIAGSEGCERTGDCKACTGDRGGWRPQYVDDRSAWRWQIDAGRAAARFVAAARRAGGARDFHGAIAGRRIARPLLDRIDIHVEVNSVSAQDLALPPPAEGTAALAARVASARQVQRDRNNGSGVRTNAEAEGELLDEVASPDSAGKRLLTDAADAMRLTARDYHRVLRVARTIADLAGAQAVQRAHIAEALSYRRLSHALN